MQVSGIYVALGSECKIFMLAMYISCFFVLISFAFGSQRKPSFLWNMGFIILMPLYINISQIHIDNSSGHPGISTYLGFS